MNYNYRPFVGREYQPPHGCFTLVRQVFEEAYGINLGQQDEGLDGNNIPARMARLHDRLAKLGEQVSNPVEGDVILIRSLPFHLGIVIDPMKGEMLHNYSGGSACVESYKAGRWSNRVVGFWRYRT